jgi:mono/diheme cytochrome c family protein
MACAGEPAGADRELAFEQLASLTVRPDAAARPAPRTSPVERGRYLVSHAAACSTCHSPHAPDGSFDPRRWLSGVDCYVDAVPQDPNTGCLSTRNLTNHETGLKNRTDAEIKAMLQRGVRPDGKALHPFMPYAYYANMSDADADAIIAYLRTVPGVNHTITPSQPPFLPPPAPAARIDEARAPQPRADYQDREAALRGRYIAVNLGTCLSCHTQREAGQLALDKAFMGGLSFTRSAVGLPLGHPEQFHSPNITPHATGIADYGVDDVVRALKHGVDKQGDKLCPPMPAGPKLAFGGLTDDDARDVAHYLLSLPPRENAIQDTCVGPDEHARAPKLPAPDDARDFYLSQTGLYDDIAAKRVAPELHAFAPAFELWSDGAQKARWLYLPAGTRIDSRDMAHWDFPIGAMLFKEFARGGKRIETRLIARTAQDGYWMGAFVWNEDESDARYVPDGMRDARGTPHDVPSRAQCGACHNGEPGRILGFSAVQQPNAPPALLSHPITRAFAPPGDARAQAALGYLHANCGHCHNPSGGARPDTDLDLQLRPSDYDLHTTGAYRSAVDRPTLSFKSRSAEHALRVAPGDPQRSAVPHRMLERAPEIRMPPIGSEEPDRAGAARVRGWIQGM